jgi:hypothetical protein
MESNAATSSPFLPHALQINVAPPPFDPGTFEDTKPTTLAEVAAAAAAAPRISGKGVSPRPIPALNYYVLILKLLPTFQESRSKETPINAKMHHCVIEFTAAPFSA